MSHAVVYLRQRVLVVEYLRQSLATCIARERRGISHVEIAVVVEDQPLRHERLALIGHRGRAAQFLSLHVLEPLTTP